MSLEPGGTAVMLLLNPTGGVLGGDVLETRVELDAGSRVCLSTPSATRVYRSEIPAVQRFSATLGSGAVLEWLPDHVIPSPGARLCQSAEIALDPRATVLLADTWATGRLARGEPWGFRSLDSALTVRDQRGLLLRERCVLGCAGRGGLGGTEGFGYVGTFAALRAGEAPWPELADELAGDLERAGADARAGVSVLGRGGLLVRLLCRSAPALDAVVRAVWARCRHRLLGLPPLALRKL
jgi:urease accessory protein